MCRSILAISAVLATLTACSGDQGVESAAPSPGDDTTGSIGCSGGCTVIDPSAPYHVQLTAREVVGGSAESGTGSGDIDLDSVSGKIRGSVSFEGVEPDAVSLRRGFAGERGPVLVWLDRVGNTDWSLPPSTTLAPSQIEAFSQGGLYLEATTAGSSAPAVRGQIIRGGAIQVRFAQFSGGQVVPAMDSSATALGAITLYGQVSDAGVVSNNRSMVIHVNGSGLEDIVSAHAHAAMAGANGPILAELVPDPDDPSHWSSAGPLEPGRNILDAFANSSLYFDIHTATHPEGEVRAQIGRWNDPRFLTLDGGDVVPAVDTGHRGIAAMTTTDYIGWNWEPEITMHVNLSGIDDATAVTLNPGALGQNAEPAISLEQSPDDPSHWSIVNATLEEPLDHAYWYVSVLTPGFPNGELRAQIASSSSRITGPDGLAVTAVDPADGATLAALPPVITIEFNRVVLSDPVSADSILLLASGGDASFNDGNEIPIIPVAVTSSGRTLTVDLSGLPSQEDTYQLSIEGAAETPFTDASGTPVKSDFITTFAVDTDHESPPTFQQIQETLLTPSCAKSGCHSGARAPYGLDLSSGIAFENIVHVPSAEAPQNDLIEPGDPASSYLLSKLTTPAWPPHTQGEPELSNAMIQRLREWIAAGASND
jgi:hypothetical protein